MATKSRSYTYDEIDWLILVTDDTDPFDPFTIYYEYDKNGNTIKKIDGSLTNQEMTFTYNALNQLVETKRGPPEAEIILGRYDYNASGLRVRHRLSERGDVDYYYDDNAVIEERNATNDTLLAHYRYADRLISLDVGGARQYYHHDALGSTVNLTTAEAKVQVSYKLDPWGHIREQIGSSVNRQIFTGQELDEKTGLIYFGARYYDPDTARFITQDSYLGESGTPPSLNRYLYAYSNPTVYLDLYGFLSEEGYKIVQDWLDTEPYDIVGERNAVSIFSGPEFETKQDDDGSEPYESVKFYKDDYSLAHWHAFILELGELEASGVDLSTYYTEDFDNLYSKVAYDETPKGLLTSVVGVRVGKGKSAKGKGGSGGEKPKITQEPAPKSNKNDKSGLGNYKEGDATPIKFGKKGEVYALEPAPTNPKVRRWQRKNKPEGSKNKHFLKYARQYHEKRATELFGEGKGKFAGGRHYDKKYKGKDIEYKSDNFKKKKRSKEELDRMIEQAQKDVKNKIRGKANPHWHFENDPTIVPEMKPVLDKLKEGNVSVTSGSDVKF